MLRFWQKAVRNLKPSKALHFNSYQNLNYRFSQKPGSRAKNILFVSAGIIAIFMLILILPEIRPGESVSEGIVGIYTTSNLPPHVINLISMPLVTIDKSGNPQPGLADHWEVNQGASVYKFYLKDNLYWDDSTKVKSKEIKINIPDVAVEYPDDNTIVFKLADSFAPFPTLLASPILKNNTLVGIGKYKVDGVETTHGVLTKLTLQPNLQKDSKDPTLPVVNIRFYPDEKIARTAFMLGEVDSLFGISGGAELTNTSSVRERGLANYNKLTAVFFNTKDPILSDKNMRRALGVSTPDFTGEQMAKTSIPEWSWAYNSALKSTRGDLDGAKNYLSKVENGKDSQIILTTTPALAGVGEQIVQSWKLIGISAVLRVESGIPQNFQALLISESIPADPDQYSLWHSTQTQTNISQYSSARVDKNLEDGRKTADREKRRELYLDLQKVLQDDLPAVFLYFPKINVIYRTRIETNLNKILGWQTG